MFTMQRYVVDTIEFFFSISFHVCMNVYEDDYDYEWIYMSRSFQTILLNYSVHHFTTTTGTKLAET